MDTIRYDDRWYLSESTSNLSVRMDFSDLSCGMTCVDDLDIDTIQRLETMDKYSIYNYEDMKNYKDSDQLTQFGSDMKLSFMSEEDYDAISGSGEAAEELQSMGFSTLEEMADYNDCPVLNDKEILKKVGMLN